MIKKIKDQILKVRDDGRTNMFDIKGVMCVANDLRLYELVVYLDDRANQKEYFHLIRTGEAEITDEEIEDEDDTALDGDDVESPPSTHEEQKTEAIKRLRMLFADDTIPEAFEKTGTVYLCDSPDGNPIPIPMEMMEDIRLLEKQWNLLVYLVIADSWSYSYLYVSQYKDEWDMDIEDLGEGYPVVYVENLGDPECSEFGSIRICPNNSGGFIRTA